MERRETQKRDPRVGKLEESPERERERERATRNCTETEADREERCQR